MEYHIFVCPHCSDPVQIFTHELNCKIFRHGIYKENFQQINPHSSKIICDQLFATNQIYGCGKPFRIDKSDDKYIIVECDYI